MTDPPLLRPDETPDDLTRNQNRELARRQAFGELGPPTGGGGSGVVLLVMPWLFVLAAVFALATWFSARTAGVRDLLEGTPLGSRLAVTADGVGGDPGVVAGATVGVVLAVAVGLTIARAAYWRRWFQRGGRALTLRTALWVMTLARSLVLVAGLAFASVAGGVARGADLDPAFRPTDVSGWWPWVVVGAACVWVSLGSVRRTTNKVVARILSVVAAESPA